MNKLREFFSALTALNDWQEEAERAVTYNTTVSSCRTATGTMLRTASEPKEPVVIKRDALVLDLVAYRAKRETA